MKVFEHYPSDLTKNRNIIEGNFIFCLWKEPELYGDYKEINANNDFLLDDSKFYYTIGLEMYNLGYKSFDEATIAIYFENRDTLKKGFENRGGYRTVIEIMRILDIDNIEVYYDELIRSNIILSLYDKGFNVMNDLDKLNKMTSDQIYDYYDYMLSNIMINKGSNIEIEDLIIDDDFIADCNSGEDIGLNYGKTARILNYITLGIPKGNLYLVGGHSGIGKTSWAFANMAIPVVENGHKVCIISNEQRSKEFKTMLLAMTLANDLNYYGLTRKKIKQGDFNEEQLKYIEMAKNITKNKYEDKLKFVRMFNYDIGSVKRVIKKMSKQGYELFIYDTMKSEDLVDGQFWQSLVEHSKELFQLASKENVAVVTTYQLAPHMINKRYLDVSCLSNAKQIKEVYSEMIYFREIWDDEFNDEKYDIKPYNLKKDENGKYTNIKEIVELDPDKKYLVGFVDKTRNDDRGQNVLYEFNGRYNTWKEIGFCTVYHDRTY